MRRRTPRQARRRTGAYVWVGAHPDDELYVAPWLGEQCVEKKAECTMLVMTRGEGGKCKLAGGCAPDLATVRGGELAASAARFGATLVHWDLGDGTSSDIEAIASFDPRHGDSCHPDHRAAGAITILARRSLAAAPGVTMVASKQIVAKAAPDDPDVIAYDASTQWSFLVDTLKTHASQFTADEVMAVEAVPAAQGKTFLLAEEKATEDDPRYADVCP